MAICRCKDHPPKGRKHEYTYYAFPIGYKNTSCICGKRNCEKSGVIYLVKTEYDDFVNRERRIFDFFSTQISKVKVENKKPVKL